eukprot:2506844-Prymnesium_polylepis.1
MLAVVVGLLPAFARPPFTVTSLSGPAVTPKPQPLMVDGVGLGTDVASLKNKIDILQVQLQSTWFVLPLGYFTVSKAFEFFSPRNKAIDDRYGPKRRREPRRSSRDGRYRSPGEEDFTGSRDKIKAFDGPEEFDGPAGERVWQEPRRSSRDVHASRGEDFIDTRDKIEAFNGPAGQMDGIRGQQELLRRSSPDDYRGLSPPDDYRGRPPPDDYRGRPSPDEYRGRDEDFIEPRDRLRPFDGQDEMRAPFDGREEMCRPPEDYRGRDKDFTDPRDRLRALDGRDRIVGRQDVRQPFRDGYRGRDNRRRGGGEPYGGKPMDQLEERQDRAGGPLAFEVPRGGVGREYEDDDRFDDRFDAMLDERPDQPGGPLGYEIPRGRGRGRRDDFDDDDDRFDDMFDEMLVERPGRPGGPLGNEFPRGRGRGRGRREYDDD